jgi:hypothetical protein
VTLEEVVRTLRGWNSRDDRWNQAMATAADKVEADPEFKLPQRVEALATEFDQARHGPKGDQSRDFFRGDLVARRIREARHPPADRRP